MPSRRPCRAASSAPSSPPEENSIPEAPRQTYVSIQLLRGVAAISVVVFHCGTQVERMGFSSSWPNFLASGVDLFFVVSGFIMFVTTNNQPVSPLDFARRRIIRIVPLYWLITTVYLAILLVAPQALQSAKADGPHILASYLFIPWPHPALDTTEPLVVPGWTLNLEMGFYALFALALFLTARLRAPIIIATLAALALLGWLLQPTSGWAAFYTQSIILEFALGILIGLATSRGLRIPPATGPVLILLGALALIHFGHTADPSTRILTRGFPAAMLVVGALCLEQSGRLPYLPRLAALGDASYSIYLTHGVVLSAAAQTWRRVAPDTLTTALTFAIVGTLLSAVVGLLTYRFLERPITRWLASSRRAAQPR